MNTHANSKDFTIGSSFAGGTVPPGVALESSAMAATVALALEWISRNPCPVVELPGLLSTLHGAVSGLAPGAPTVPPGAPFAKLAGRELSAVMRRTVFDDHLVSLEDGRSYRSLRRHLKARGLTPEAYIAKHGLPDDYPMVAPGYSRRRSEIARAVGLGRNKKPRG